MPGYQTSFDGRVKGKTKEQIGEEYCTCYGIGHFAAGHALLLLSGGGSVETLRSIGVKDSDVVFAGTGCSTVASLILSHKALLQITEAYCQDVSRMICSVQVYKVLSDSVFDEMLGEVREK